MRRGNLCDGVPDQNIAEASLPAASDTGSSSSYALCCNGAAVNGDISTAAVKGAADTGRLITAYSCDRTAVDDDIA